MYLYPPFYNYLNFKSIVNLVVYDCVLIWRNIMKTFIYMTLFFLTLNSLYAQELQDINSSEKKSSNYKLSLTSFDFDKRDLIVPGVTLDLTPEESKYKTFHVTLAHNLFKSLGSSLEKVNLMKTALYAQMNFRF